MTKRKKLMLVLTIGGVIGILLLIRFIDLFVLFLCALFLAYLLRPVINIFTASSVPVTAAIFVTYAMLFTVFLFLLIVAVPAFCGEMKALIAALPVYYNYVLSLWERYVTDAGYMKYIASLGLDAEFLTYFDRLTARFVENTVGTLTILPQTALSFILVPVIAFYLLRDKEMLTERLWNLLSPARRVEFNALWERIDAVLMGFIRGTLLVSVFVAVVTALGLFLLGVDYAVVLGLLYGIFDMIPYFGPFIGALPVLALSMLQGDVNPVLLIILLICVQQGESIFITPRVVGSSVGLHPVSVIFLVLIGAAAGGVFGMVLAVPLAAVMKLILLFFYEKLVATAID